MCKLMSALLLSVVIIFYHKYQGIGFALFFLTYFIEIFVDKKWKFINIDKRGIYFLMMLFFFFLAFFYYPFDNSPKHFWSLLPRRLSIAGFALVALLGVNRLYKMSYFLHTFIVTSVVIIIYLIVVRIGLWEFIKNPLRATMFSGQRNSDINLHMMFDFYLNVSLVSIWYIVSQRWKLLAWWKILLYAGAFLLIVFVVSISEGRSGFVEGMFLLLSFAIVEIWKRKTVLGIIFVVLLPFLLFGIVKQHNRISGVAIEQDNRMILWRAAMSVVEQSPIIGHGISNTQEQLDVARAKYQTESAKMGWADSPRVDSHSQYFQTTMEFGLIGLAMLLCIYLFPIYFADDTRKIFSIFLCFLSAFQSLFDTFITAQFSTIFGILLLLTLIIHNDIAPKQPV